MGVGVCVLGAASLPAQTVRPDSTGTASPAGADAAASAITGVVCGAAAVGAVALFFADRICLRAPKDGKTAAKGAESEKDFGKVAKNR